MTGTGLAVDRALTGTGRLLTGTGAVVAVDQWSHDQWSAVTAVVAHSLVLVQAPAHILARGTT